jgi:hypothetical protein
MREWKRELGRPGVDGSILKWASWKQDGRMWIAFTWLRIGTND